MKRSEMEIYLEQNLIELRGYQEDNAEIVDVLLYAIEEAGMLPPAKHIDIASGRILHYYIQDSLERNEILSEVQEEWDYVIKDTSILWEPEDD